MSEPIAIQAPQPSSIATSRIGTAGFAIGIAIVALVLAAALIGNWLVPADPFTQDLGNRLKPPFWMEGSQAGHLLGTDQLGRDYLARLVYGARISLLIGIMTVITSGLIGTTLGVLGGSIVIETVFALHGVGYLGWESIAKNDFPVVQAVVLVLAVFYIGLTLLADILNALLDPRLRTG